MTGNFEFDDLLFGCGYGAASLHPELVKPITWLPTLKTIPLCLTTSA